MREQCCERGKWRQNYPGTHKSSFTKKSRGTNKATQSKQISTLISKQVAAEMQKFNQSINVDTTTTSPSSKSAQNNEQYLMSVVQAAVAKHFATPPTTLPNPTPFNLKSIIKQACNSSPSWCPAVSTLYSFERRKELKLDWNKDWDPGHTTGI